MTALGDTPTKKNPLTAGIEEVNFVAVMQNRTIQK